MSRTDDAASPLEIQQELDRILSSGTFAAARRLRQLIEYLVRHHLGGTGAKLKEYSIAHDVFRRDASFDPGIDSIVRTETSRLRSKLTRYYRDEGRKNPLRLDLRRSFELTVARIPSTISSNQTNPGSQLKTFHLALLFRGAGHACHAEISALLQVELGMIPGLKVVVPESARALASQRGDIRAIADRLDAERVLECDTEPRRDGVNLRLCLLDGLTGACIYSRTERIRGAVGSNLLRRVARDFAHYMQAQMVCRGSPLADAAVGDLSTTFLDSLLRLRFRFKYRPGSVIDAAKCMAWFDEAVEREPDNALIRRGWLLSLATFACLVPASLPDVLLRLRGQMRQTQSSTQATVEAHIAAGMTSMFNGEYHLAADRLYRAAELAPQNADARIALSTFLLQVGESEQALREARAGEQLDPLSASNAGMVALSLINLDRFEEARTQSERSLSLDPAFLLSRMMVADLDLLAGHSSRAVQSMTEICTLTGQHPLARGKLAYACGITGDASRARAMLQDLLASANNTRQVAPSIVLGYLGLREQKKALQWLRIAGDQNSIVDIMPGRLPFFDPLRNEPSFNALMPKYR